MIPPQTPSSLSQEIPGARVDHDGVHYRIWAPDHARLRLHVQRAGGRASQLDLEPGPDGFFNAFDSEGKAGDLYLYELPDGRRLPDVASRFQPQGVHGPSECVDPRAYAWKTKNWERPGWSDPVIYELHLGTFTPEGTFRAAIEKLDHLKTLGVTAIELMPVGDFPGNRNWGYDGVALYAPARCYGRPDDFRALIDAAHARGLAVILDVVYNHLGPDGNYLPAYSSGYFHPTRESPWGRALNFDGENSRPVRDFIVGNLAYWMDEYNIDGFRLDAVHALPDESERHILAELAEAAHARGGFVIAEDERNQADLVARDGVGRGATQLDALWADDFHHQVRVALTGLNQSYFESYSGSIDDLAQTLNHGWYFRGQPFPFWKGRPRGQSPSHLPPSAFVYCIENHDQIGNRAHGERLEHLIPAEAFRAASALLFLCPYTPMLFMGQEWAASTSFLYFTDHDGPHGEKVSAVRKKEFADTGMNQGITDVPDPQAATTFERSRLDWTETAQRSHREVFTLYRELLRLRGALARDGAFIRENWSAAAVMDVLAIRYFPPGHPQRLLLVALRPGARVLLSSHPFLSAPYHGDWRIELDTNHSQFRGTRGRDPSAAEDLPDTLARGLDEPATHDLRKIPDRQEKIFETAGALLLAAEVI